MPTMQGQLCPMLSEAFFRLAAYAQQAIRRALGPKSCGGPSSALPGVVSVDVTSEAIMLPQELDLLLPKVCEALVLITQCIVTLALAAEDDDASNDELKIFFNDARSDRGEGLVESLLGHPMNSIAYPAYS